MISIAQRLRLFSHQPGVKCLLPGTSYIVEAFPALVRVWNQEGILMKEIYLEIEGPLKQFTLMQDLERGCVTVYSEIYRFHILPNLDLSYQKHPPLAPFKVKERLALGAHKKQEWEAIKRRGDFCEIFPFWFRLGAALDLPARSCEDQGPFALLKNAKEALFNHQPENILAYFKKIFLAGFNQMLVPSSRDENHQGILPANCLSKESPLYLLSEGSALIRSLFFLAAQNEFSILPNLPPEFFSGRMVNMNCAPYGILHFEWSKKTIRKLHFQAEMDGELLFHFPAQMRRFRLRTNLKEFGKHYACGDSLEIKSGSHYLLDQFQK